ncbi:hypothetical protein GCM10009718_18310 [Isoptericola halotolerans]|uniref:WxL domain-containing protein n=1 Tax=Isoptericola halotolerans TaxID=300560 RepID=A0ABX2A9G1_9MICO|nr:hypothetical protein [Isoptericola halotolerans]NOV98582.1 hypothetical protein [Isoptericola halotolerans]
MDKNAGARRMAVGVSVLAMAGVVGLASAAAGDDDSDGVDLSVTIEDLSPPGTLAMSVAAHDAVELAEDGSDDDARQFTGALPTVTVSDTRSAEQVPEGSYWAVVGQAADFTSDGADAFGAEYLGWTPRLVAGPGGDVAAGEPVSSVIADGSGADAVGLQGQELLVSTWASEPGTWGVEADLTLRVPTDTPAGDYSSTLTLSLFEG